MENDVVQIVKTTEEKMKKAIEVSRNDMSVIRTGRASAALLDKINIDYYGAQTPINQVASISVPEARLIVVQPWDKGIINEIERAIQKSELGLTPSNDGTIIRLPVPPLTEERRKDLVKVVHKIAEEGRIAVRNIRRDAVEKFRDMEKNHQISQDEMHTRQDEVQKLTDKYISEIDNISKNKEKDIFEV